MKSVSIIIVNYNLTEEVRNLLKSIELNVKIIDYEVIIVDNNSPDRSIETLVQEFPDFRFELLNTNYGFGHGNNVGASISSGDYLLLLNPDTYLDENLPLKLYQFAQKHPDFGVIGPRMNFPDGSIQISAAKFPNLKQEIGNTFGVLGLGLKMLYRLKKIFYRGEYYNVDFVFGSCMFIRRKIFDQAQGFDEQYFLLSEEVDLCYIVKKKLKSKVIYWRGAKVFHLKSQITGKDVPLRLKLAYESRLKFFRKHYSPLRVIVLRYYIIFMFVFNHIILFRKKDKKPRYKAAYQHIINNYLKQNK